MRQGYHPVMPGRREEEQSPTFPTMPREHRPPALVAKRESQGWHHLRRWHLAVILHRSAVWRWHNASVHCRLAVWRRRNASVLRQGSGGRAKVGSISDDGTMPPSFAVRRFDDSILPLSFAVRWGERARAISTILDLKEMKLCIDQISNSKILHNYLKTLYQGTNLNDRKETRYCHNMYLIYTVVVLAFKINMSPTRIFLIV